MSRNRVPGLTSSVPLTNPQSSGALILLHDRLRVPREEGMVRSYRKRHARCPCPIRRPIGQHSGGIAILALWTGMACLAQVPAPPPLAVPGPDAPLSLPQATAMAIQSHPQISAAQNTAAAANQRITESRAAYYPTVDGEVTAAQ